MIILPSELEPVRQAALRAISPVRQPDDSTRAEKHFLFNAKRTDAGRDLPPYYLCYFLLVDLLGFKDLGQFEKVAWSVPIDFNGQAFLIEHRKLGVGVFAHDPEAEEPQCRQIVSLIKKGVKTAEPFFEWLAERAVGESKLNIVNKSDALFNRYQYFLTAHAKAEKEAEERADERHEETRDIPGGTVTTVHMPVFELRDNVRWLALAAVDAFFSWTEHVFIHMAVLRGTVTSGIATAELADADWQEKFKHALDIKQPTTKIFFDDLIEIRRQLRNFMAHGAFSKQGEAFSFHSGAGAVPVLLPHKLGKRRFAISAELAIEDTKALKIIREFIQHLWSGDREPAYHYIQETGLPSILTYAQDGTYRSAMQSVEAMREFVEYQCHRWAQAANMDW